MSILMETFLVLLGINVAMLTVPITRLLWNRRKARLRRAEIEQRLNDSLKLSYNASRTERLW